MRANPANLLALGLDGLRRAAYMASIPAKPMPVQTVAVEPRIVVPQEAL
jgi:hypothetical protein